MIKTLKEYIKLLFEISEEEYLLSLEDGSKFENELAKHGIVPIKHARGMSRKYTSFLGRGCYTEAFEVLYKGKRAVAKVTKSMIDIDNVLALDALRDRVPADVAKHILHVYAYVDLPNIKRKCVVVEMLAPMPASLRHEYWGGSVPGGKDYDRSKLRYDALIDKIDEFLLIVLSASNLRFVLDKNELRGLRNSVMRNNDFKALKSKFLSTSRVQMYLHNIFYKELSSRQFSDKLKQKKYNIDHMSSALTDRFVDYLRLYVGGEKVPQNAIDEEEGLDIANLHEDKRVKSFIRALQYLRDRHQIHWFDMHEQNVMIRPSTKELVISDPGLFDL